LNLSHYDLSLTAIYYEPLSSSKTFDFSNDSVNFNSENSCDIGFVSEMIPEKLIFGHLSIYQYFGDFWFFAKKSPPVRILNYD
jgi:hypothetical protein